MPIANARPTTRPIAIAIPEWIKITKQVVGVRQAPEEKNPPSRQNTATTNDHHHYDKTPR